MPTRVGRTPFVYDAAGRVVRTVTKRISKKPLVRFFYYATGAQPIGFDSSDQPGVGYRYVYDGFGRRVAKETIDTATGNVTERVVFVHAGDQLVAEHTTVGADRGRGFVWTTDPGTGEIIGQITLTPQTSSAGGKHRGGNYPNGDAQRADVSSWSQDEVDAEFFAIVTDLAGASHEIIHPDTGKIVGTATQTLYGQRTWRGEQSSPLLFAGQYADVESGWAYNRFRCYNPHAGIYNAQDPLGAPPRLASAQGYVDHAAFWVDEYGLKSCRATHYVTLEQLKHAKVPKADRMAVKEYLNAGDVPTSNYDFYGTHPKSGEDAVTYAGISRNLESRIAGHGNSKEGMARVYLVRSQDGKETLTLNRHQAHAVEQLLINRIGGPVGRNTGPEFNWANKINSISVDRMVSGVKIQSGATKWAQSLKLIPINK